MQKISMVLYAMQYRSMYNAAVLNKKTMLTKKATCCLSVFLLKSSGPARHASKNARHLSD
jgi:hypothetical protein